MSKLSKFQPSSSVKNCRNGSRDSRGNLKSSKILKKVEKTAKTGYKSKPTKLSLHRATALKF